MTAGQHLYELLGRHFGKDHVPWSQLTHEEQLEFEEIAREMAVFTGGIWS